VELSEVGSLFRENQSGYYCTGDLPGSVIGALIIEFGIVNLSRLIRAATIIGTETNAKPFDAYL
jgi:hypothetical protein